MRFGSWLSDKYNKLFAGLLFSIVVAFFGMRPLNSPWHPFIAGDGLGYYSYLPAKFIHGDPNLDFKWFNRVYSDNYVYSAFENPEDNLLVAYQGKKINKYYPGLSYIWLPFFITAHAITKIFHLNPSGFSQPYQYAIGLAGLFYFFLGFIALRKLLLRLFPSAPLAATLAPGILFYGSHLIDFAFNYNSHAHIYSFSFICLFYYAALRFKQEQQDGLLSLCLLFLFFVVTVSIRPLNGLILLTLPAFIKWDDLKNRRFEKIRAVHLLVIAAALGAVVYHFYISHLQTGSLFAYTYSNERFNVAKNRFLDSLFSYYIGLLVYVPLFMVAVVGAFFTKRRLSVILGGFFLAVLFLYSSWWYWPITKRAMVDFYAIPGIFLTAALQRPAHKRNFVLLILVCTLCIAYYQLKKYQIEKGILTEYINDKDLYWKNFFELRKLQQYPVPSGSILHTESRTEDFETEKENFNLVTEPVKSGRFSHRMDSANGVFVMDHPGFPAMLNDSGSKVIRLSFDCYVTKPVKQLHAFLVYLDKEGRHLLEIPFYINEEDIRYNAWDHKEFGYRFQAIAHQGVEVIRFQIWNVEGRNAVTIDNAKMEFILTDYRFESLLENF